MVLRLPVIVNINKEMLGGPMKKITFWSVMIWGAIVLIYGFEGSPFIYLYGFIVGAVCQGLY